MLITLIGGIGVYIYSETRTAKTTGEKTDIAKNEKESKEANAFAEAIGKENAFADLREVISEQPEKEPESLEIPEYTYEQGKKWFEPKEEGKTVLAFAGDILFDDEYSIMANMNKRTGGIYDTISEDLLAEMTGADIFMLNNEFTYTLRGEPVLEKQFTFRADPEDASYLLDMGVDIVSLANNHAYDYGEISLLDSMDTLAAMEMPYVGAGVNIEAASRPFFFETEGLKIGILSATQIERLDNPDTKGATETSAGVFRCWDGTLLYEKTEEAAEECDFLVVYVHWGSENTTELDWAQKDQAKKLAQAGADLIIGNHSHCLQGIEMIEGVPVFYSLGNFLFNSKTVDTCLVKAEIEEGKLSRLQFIPALQSGCRVEMLTGSEKARVIQHMQSLSSGITIDMEGYISY